MRPTVPSFITGSNIINEMRPTVPSFITGSNVINEMKPTRPVFSATPATTITTAGKPAITFVQTTRLISS